MIRRSFLEISSYRIARRIPRHPITQIPSCVSSRKEFSTKSKEPDSTTSKATESGSSLSKFVVGSVALGTAFLAAYKTGYLDQYLGNEQDNSHKGALIGARHIDFKNGKLTENLVSPTNEKLGNVSPAAGHGEHIDFKDGNQTEYLVSPTTENPNYVSPAMEHGGQRGEAHISQPEGVKDKQDPNQFLVESKSGEEGMVANKENEIHELLQSQSSILHDVQSKESQVPVEGIINVESPKVDTSGGLVHNDQSASTSMPTSGVQEEIKTHIWPPQHLKNEEKSNDAISKTIEPPAPLLEAYCLKDKAEEVTASFLYGQGLDENHNLSYNKESLSSAIEELNGGYISKDGKLVLDFLQAIHAAEKRQAELDAQAFAREKKALKEKYEKELKDAAARELMRAEEAAMLDRELKRERAKAAAAINSLQERMEEKMKLELEQKESETEAQLKKLQELAKAELNAAIANEKATQIEKMAEANLNINALCMAFYARSEESRRSHAAHKLALGTLAIEDSLSKGLPIQTELEALHSYLEGIDKDSVLELVLSSLPEEARKHGTDTLLQLNQKFDALKGTLRHFSFIPPGGGGLLAHSVAHIASWLKVKEVDQSGDGIESVINKVECYLAEGSLAEAANILEECVKGTQAEEIVGYWVRQARNRAITEQALTLLQSYATSISLT